MHNIINRLYLLKYLNRFYTISGDKFYDKYNNLNRGISISNELCLIFSIDKLFVDEVFKIWALANGLEEDKWDEAYWNYKQLGSSWTSEMAQDIEPYYGIDVESELTRLLSVEISREMLSSLGVPREYLNSNEGNNNIQGNNTIRTRE